MHLWTFLGGHQQAEQVLCLQWGRAHVKGVPNSQRQRSEGFKEGGEGEECLAQQGVADEEYGGL